MQKLGKNDMEPHTQIPKDILVYFPLIFLFGCGGSWWDGGEMIFGDFFPVNSCNYFTCYIFSPKNFSVIKSLHKLSF